MLLKVSGSKSTNIILLENLFLVQITSFNISLFKYTGIGIPV